MQTPSFSLFSIRVNKRKQAHPVGTAKKDKRLPKVIPLYKHDEPAVKLAKVIAMFP